MILSNALAAARGYKATARNAVRERSSDRLERLLASDLTSPSGGESLLRLAKVLALLPDDQRRVIELHHLKGLTVAAVATEIGHTRPAVAGLLFRGLRRLCELLTENGEGAP